MKDRLNFADYYKNFNKAFAKYGTPCKTSRKIIKDNPDIIPADANDIYNYVARYDMANYQIQAIMKLGGKLDFKKLKKAVRLSVDAEPVLGCRFVKRSTPYWKRCEDIDNIEFCSFVETDNPDEAVQKFLESPLDMDNDPMVKVILIRSGAIDTLGVKMSHVCCDAAGAREYIHLLSDIYCRIDNRDNEFVPNPSKRDKNDHYRLLNSLTENPAPSWDPLAQTAMPTWKFPWKNSRTGATGFAVCRLPQGHLDIMKSYGKARGATINDLILTAVFRAMFEISRPPYGIPMDIPLTIDLRKFLPDKKAEAIRNLSGGVVIRLDRKPKENFEDTLSRIVALTTVVKNGRPSIRSLKWAEFIESMNFHQICAYFKAESQLINMMSQSPVNVFDKCCPILSNFGFISKSLIKFGENVVTDAYIIPPVVRAPGILLVASTYNGVITLGVGYYKSSVNRSHMEGLLDKIRDELVEGCRAQE